MTVRLSDECHKNLMDSYHTTQLRVRELEEALQKISRMSVFPDDKVNRFTMAAAVHIANEALGSGSKGD